MLDRLASVRPRTLVVLALVTLAGGALLFGVWPGPRVEELGGGPILDTRGLAAGRDAAAYVDALGSEGRRLYTLLLLGDAVWAVVHGLALAVGIAVGSGRAGRARLAPLVALPALYAVLDLAEGALFLATIRAHPAGPPVPEALIGAVTVTKFVALGLSYLALVASLSLWWRARRTV